MITSFKPALCRAALAASVLLLPAAHVFAVPAKPGLVERHQADGSVVSVQLRGDEHSHFILSEDGYPLAEVAGLLYYASVDADGAITPSAIRATDIAARTAEAKTFLASVDAEAAVESMARACVKAPRTKVMQKGPGLMDTTFPGKGSPRSLVILVSYSDVDFKIDNPKEYFTGLLNTPGFSEWNGTGSARDYFIESSCGQFSPQFDVLGPVKLPKRMIYYGGNDAAGNDLHPEMMAIHACQILDDDVDFSVYDVDGDGAIDNVFIFYAGRGEASGGSDNTVWPHSWDVRGSGNHIFDGVLLGHYACTNEWQGNAPDGIGTFCHEFSHVLGLPDLYATSYTNAFTPGSWSILDSGPYNNDSRTPPIYSAFERYAMDWLTPEEISGPANIVLPPIGSNRAYIIPTGKSNEYFLLENRQQVGWDRYIPGHGMLVWHVDYDEDVWRRNVVNNTASHQYVDIEEADNTRSDYSRPGDAFPGRSNITSFTDDTAPSMKAWSGERLELPITDIKETNGIITFKVAGGAPESSDTVTALAASYVTFEGFTASWQPLPDVERYRLEVYRDTKPAAKAGMMKAPAAFSIDAGTATSHEVKGLDPETDYAFVVFAEQKGKGVGAPSNEIKVSTLAAPFDRCVPVALQPKEITDTCFTACWKELKGADNYLLRVSKLSEYTCEYDRIAFDNGAAELPAGWKSSSSLLFTEPEMCGQSSPALKMRKDGATLQSPEYSADVMEFSFWQRAEDAAADNKIAVSLFVDNEWQPADTIAVTTAAGGETVKLTDFPIHTRAVRLTYIKAESDTIGGCIAIDDVAVGWNPTYQKESLPLYFDRITEGALSMKVTGLTAGTRYGYTVVGVRGEERSQESNLIVLMTDGMLGVGSVESDLGGLRIEGLDVIVPVASAAVCDAAGRAVGCASATDGSSLRITLPAPGLYVVYGGGRAWKVRVG